MLILTRRVGETIRITDEIEVTIQHAKPSSVQIGVDAPDSVSIVRAETAQGQQQTKQREN